jgi:hypothetical protein
VHDTLIRLDALVTAHFAQEDEFYSSLNHH